ncbi:ADP/ATP carrier receptor [Lentinula raphanica]|nr:ADP/ATP carrier receptor [Lentinula raphanica]
MSSNPSTTATTTLVDRVQTFVSENKQAILIGTAAAAAIAVGGVAYYASTSSSSRRSSKTTDAEKGEKGEKKDKKKKKKKGGLGVNDAEGPILEERKTKAKVEDSFEPARAGAELCMALVVVLTCMSERTRIAGLFKAQGNDAYKTRDYAKAAKLYSRAIEISPKAEPVFYSNRAACYMNMDPAQYVLVVQDCDEAIKLDPTYVKALNRRASAFESLERYAEALRDYTATTVLEKFTNQATPLAVERVLKLMSTKNAQEILKNRGPKLPPATFVQAYFAAFRAREGPGAEAGEAGSEGDRMLVEAFKALEENDYKRAWEMVNDALEKGVSWDVGRSEGLNLRGTFKFLVGDVEGAKADLNESIKLVPSFTQSLVKIASVYMEQGEVEKAFECFEEAIKHNPEDPDIYYHRGQVLFIMNKFDEAAENYTKSTELDDQFVFSHIQLAVAHYKAGNLASAMAQFRRTMKSFPQRSEPLNYYGELLLDQQRFQDAIEKFDKAIEIEKTKTPQNVLPLVNKGLTLFQMDQNIGAAERCCNEALRIDPECEAAVATLAQLSLQQGQIDNAIKYFERSAELARTEQELAGALTYQYATNAQVEFAKNYPHLASQMNAMARSM